MAKFIFLLLLSGQISFGQTTIRGVTTISSDGVNFDSINNSPNIIFNDRIKLEQIDKSTALIDIRLYKHSSLSDTKSLHRFFLTDTIWKAVEFVEGNKPRKIKKYKLFANPGFDSFFLKLLSYNFMKLPNQSDLEDKMHKEIRITADGVTTESKILVFDGVSYTIEIKIGNKFRIYQFDNPGSYSKFYDNISELKDYLNIIQAFDKFLYRK